LAEFSNKKSKHPSGKSSVDGEMKMKSIRCYKCHKEGHIARLCPEFHMINLESSTMSIPWIRVLTVSDTTSKGEEKEAKSTCP